MPRLPKKKIWKVCDVFCRGRHSNGMFKSLKAAALIVKSYHHNNCSYNYKDLECGLLMTLDEIPFAFVGRAFNHCLRLGAGYWSYLYLDPNRYNLWGRGITWSYLYLVPNRYNLWGRGIDHCRYRGGLAGAVSEHTVKKYGSHRCLSAPIDLAALDVEYKIKREKQMTLERPK